MPFSRNFAAAILLASTVAPVLVLGGATLVSPASIGAAFALTQDVALDDIKVDFPAKKDGKGSMTIKSATFAGTNLSKEEVAKFFNLATTPEEARALAAKMTAAKVSIPEIAIAFESMDGKDANKGALTLRNFEALKVDQGKSAKLSMGGGDILVKANDVDFVKGSIGAYEIADADFSGLLNGLKQGDLAGAMVKYSKATFQGADFTVVDKETPAGAPGGNLMHFKLGPGSATASFDGDLFRKTQGEVQSLLIEFPKASKAGQGLAAFGYEKLDIGFKVNMSYDPATKKIAVDDYTITGVNAGALTIKAQLGSIDPAAFTGDKDAKVKALMGGDISSVSLRFVNNGLAEKGLAFAGAMQKKSPDALKGELSAMAKGFLPNVLGPDAGKKLGDAIAAFLASPKSLAIDVKAKGAPLKFGDLANVKGPQDVLPKLDIGAVANQ